jgi:hypothetical protein
MVKDYRSPVRESPPRQGESLQPFDPMTISIRPLQRSECAAVVRPAFPSDRGRRAPTFLAELALTVSLELLAAERQQADPKQSERRPQLRLRNHFRAF